MNDISTICLPVKVWVCKKKKLPSKKYKASLSIRYVEGSVRHSVLTSEGNAPSVFGGYNTYPTEGAVSVTSHWKRCFTSFLCTNGLFYILPAIWTTIHQLSKIGLHQATDSVPSFWSMALSILTYFPSFRLSYSWKNGGYSIAEIFPNEKQAVNHLRKYLHT